MIVGVLQTEFYLPGCSSLKEKRMIVKSVKDKISNKFNVSVAEVDYLDKWQRALIGIAVVSNKKSHSEEVLQKIFQSLDNDFRFDIVNHQFGFK